MVQISKTSLMTGGVAADLLQLANRIGPRCDVAEYEDLAGEKSLPQGGIVVDD